MANQADLPIRTICRTLDVSVSGFYAWRERTPSKRSIANAVMTERIRQIHKESQESCGMLRVRVELMEQGVCISRQRVARLMREAGTQGISKRRGFTVTTRRDKRQSPAKDLVNRKQWDGRPTLTGINMPKWKCHQPLEPKGASIPLLTVNRRFRGVARICFGRLA